MSATDELREAIEALYEVTAYLAYICERNGMNNAEGKAITDAFKRYHKAMGKEWTDDREMTATDELRRENERLWQQVASIIGRSFRTADKMDCLERENAKLRELVLDMWLHSYCSIAKTREDDERHIEDVIDRMRELRVEVEE